MMALVFVAGIVAGVYLFLDFLAAIENLEWRSRALDAPMLTRLFRGQLRIIGPISLVAAMTYPRKRKE